MRIDILSLFPGYFTGPFDESIIARAKQKKLLEIQLINIRDFAQNKHHRVDERPYGGGPGMVLMAPELKQALLSVRDAEAYVVHLSPQGNLLSAKRAQTLAQKKHLILLCGHYEGVDQRIIDHHIDEEISIGDYVLTNGALAAIVLVDAVARFIPGVLGDAQAAELDSFQDYLFDCPHYTQPEEFEGESVPAVLKSGNHAAISKWRKQSAVSKTLQCRPDLLVRYVQSKQNAQVDSKGAVAQWIIPTANLQQTTQFYRKKLMMQLLFTDDATALLQYGALQFYLIEQMPESLPFTPLKGVMIPIVDQADFGKIAKRLSNQNQYYVNIDTLNHIIYCHDPDQHLWCFYMKHSTTVDEMQ